MELKSLSISFPHFASEESEAESLGQDSWVQEGRGLRNLLSWTTANPLYHRSTNEII